jgi:membrane protein DedA with SNARE-associated domain
VSFDSLAQLVIAHGYLVIFIAIALECAALPIPGELLLLTFGGLCAGGGLDPVLGIAVAALAVVVGDSVSYWVGRLGGRRVLSRVRVTRRWVPGDLTIVFGRFVIGARVMVAPMAGLRRKAFGRFVAFDAIGALIWSSLFVLTGYGAGANLPALKGQLTSMMTVVQVIVVVAVAALITTWVLRRIPIALGAALLALALAHSASASPKVAITAPEPDVAFVRPASDEVVPAASV